VSDLNRTIDALWRIESAKLISGLARIVRDVGLAEDLAHDALVAALETWPKSGIPENPGAWLMTTAKNRAIDRLRRRKRLDQKLEQYGREKGEAFERIWPDFDEALMRDARAIEDDLLSLMFTTCHPILSNDSRVALTLRLLGGLSTDEIARAYLVQESAVAQRIVRAKRTLTEAKVPFETPVGQELASRLSAVLEVVYLIFNEGYSATSGNQWTRPFLTEEALRLGRILQGLLPHDSEVHGLAALMEIQASRMKARSDSEGNPVLLLDQDRSQWDQWLIQRGLAALEKAERAAMVPPRRALGTYALQANIAACHARARRAEDTDWPGIAALYGALAQVSPSPIVELNRAVAVAMAWGPAEGLVLVDRLVQEPALRNYPFLPGVRGDLLLKCGRPAEASAEFKRAAQLTRNDRERALLLKRAAESAAPDRALFSSKSI
jgi:RNA polymerase sigma factor (sigma-70 family)